METIKSIVSFLQQYPVWVKVLFYAWCVISALLAGGLVLGRAPEKTPEQEVTAPAGASLQGGQLLSAGRDLIVNGPIINVAARSGPPTEAELMSDVAVERNVPVHFESAPPFPHYAAVRVSARKHDHPVFYVKVMTDEQIEPKFLLQVQGYPGGVRNMIASAVMGNELEHTEASPGLQPGQPWVITVFSRKPIKVLDVVVENKSRFEDVGYRAWLHGMESALLSGKGNGAAVAPNERQWAARAVREKRLAWLPGFPDSVTLPQWIQR